VAFAVVHTDTICGRNLSSDHSSSVPCSFWKGQVKHWQKGHPKHVGATFRAHQV